MSSGFKKTLATYQDTINNGFMSFFDTYDRSSLSDHNHKTWEMMRDFSERPGKRFRGSLAMHSYRMFGGDNDQCALDAAIAMEFLQNYFLMVDDVMDRSLIRRGRPALQELYFEELRDTLGEQEARHTANMLAVNVGLLSSHVAAEVLAGVEAQPDRVAKALQIFQRNALMTGYGQIDDMYGAFVEQEEDSIIKTHTQKSSYYTFVNPMQVGAILAGVDDRELELMAAFGIPAGIAYQLQDDIIGLYGEPGVTGKSDLDDLKEGKMTLLIHRGRRHANEEQRKLIDEINGNPDITTKEALVIQELLTELGVEDSVKTTAREYAKEAKSVLASSGWDSDGIEFLDQLMDYITERLH